MFILFNSRLGCLASLVISAVVTLILLAACGGMHFIIGR
jgi:hypothetical protein